MVIGTFAQKDKHPDGGGTWVWEPKRRSKKFGVEQERCTTLEVPK